jgi:very-short-patch-repair endonuclease
MNMSEIKRLYWQQFTYEQRLAMTAASRALITGRKRTDTDLCKRAKGKQEKAKLSRFEKELFDALTAKGLFPIPQMAVDKFNIDLAFPEQLLAIEVHGGCWHNTPQKRAHDEAKRAFLEPLGWRIMVVRCRRMHWVEESVTNIIGAVIS